MKTKMVLWNFLFKITFLRVFHQIASSSYQTLFVISVLSNIETITKQISCFLSNVVYTSVNTATLRTNFRFASEETIFNASLHYVLTSINNQFPQASFNEKENVFVISRLISCNKWKITSTLNKVFQYRFDSFSLLNAIPHL